MQDEIRELMQLRGWTQADLSEQMGVSLSTAWRWYEGKAEPIPPLAKVLRAFLAKAKDHRRRAKLQRV